MKNDLLTIAEYAAIKGISTQAVYKQLQTKLKKYVAIVDNKKYIKKTALYTEKQTTYNQPCNQPATNIDNPNNQPCNQPATNADKTIIDTLNKTIKVLTEQLTEKDKQIQELNHLLQQALTNTQQALTNTSQSHYITAAAITEEKKNQSEPEQLKPLKYIKNFIQKHIY